jgi:hypothetical protein
LKLIDVCRFQQRTERDLLAGNMDSEENLPNTDHIDCVKKEKTGDSTK